MALTTTPALVLRHVDYRESDRVITVFTRDLGRIAGLARGVRKSFKRFPGRLDLFSYVDLTLKEGRGLYLFETAELRSANLGIRNELLAIAWAGHLAERVEKLFGEGEPHPHAFALLVQALEYLSQTSPPAEGVLRAVEMQLLAEAGLCPELQACVECQQPLNQEAAPAFAFSVTRGGLLCGDCGPREGGLPLPVAARAWLELALNTPLEALAWLTPQPAVVVAGRQVMDAFVRYHVGPAARAEVFLAELLSEPGGPS